MSIEDGFFYLCAEEKKPEFSKNISDTVCHV